MVEGLRAASAADPVYPPVLLISLASVEVNRPFFAERWSGARVIADPDKVVFEGFERGRGSIVQLLGPRVVFRAIGALLGGHGVGRPRQDTTVMPGVFVVRGEQVLWAHPMRDVADHPDFRSLPQTAGVG